MSQLVLDPTVTSPCMRMAGMNWNFPRGFHGHAPEEADLVARHCPKVTVHKTPSANYDPDFDPLAPQDPRDAMQALVGKMVPL